MDKPEINNDEYQRLLDVWLSNRKPNTITVAGKTYLVVIDGDPNKPRFIVQGSWDIDFEKYGGSSFGA